MTNPTPPLTLNKSIASKELALRNFAQKIAHDSNNYYGVIQGYVSLLEMQVQDDERVTKCLEPIKSALDSGIGLNKQMSSLYRVMDIMVAKQNLANLVKEAAANFTRDTNYSVEVAGKTGDLLLDVPATAALVKELCNMAKSFGNTKANFVLSEVELTEEDSTSMILDSPAGKFAEILLTFNQAKMDWNDETLFLNPYTVAAEGSKNVGVGGIFALLRNHRGNLDVTSHNQVTTLKIYFPA